MPLMLSLAFANRATTCTPMLARACRPLLTTRPISRCVSVRSSLEGGPDVQRLADLAQIEVTEEEAKEWAPKIAEIVDWFGQLEAVDVEGVEASAPAITFQPNVLRPDTPRVFEDRQRLVSEMPQMEGPFVKVPKVIMASEEQGATQGAVLDKAAAEAALVTALEGVERYLLVRAKADAALRAGWLNIARARHAMGLHRVSSTMYSSTMEARTTVPAAHNHPPPGGFPAPPTGHAHTPPANSAPTTAQPRPLDATTAENVPRDVSVSQAQPANSAVQPASDVAEEVGASASSSNAAAPALRCDALRGQLDQMQLSGDDSDAASASAASTADGNFPVDVGDLSGCLRMFGGAPSPYLRAAQDDFVRAVRALASLAAAQRDLLAAVSVLQR